MAGRLARGAYAGAKGAGGIGWSYLYATTLNPVALSLRLAEWGMSRMETKRVMEFVTPPQYDNSNQLKLHVGTFPFPRGLFEAVLRPDKIKTKKVQIFYNAMRPQDVTLFELVYVPVKYATLSRQHRAIVQKQMTKMKVASHDRSILERRLSFQDLYDPHMVRAALEMNGSKNSPRTREWIEFYSRVKGLACADANNANERSACLSHSASTRTQPKRIAKM
jgi:hypothetical protein